MFLLRWGWRYVHSECESQSGGKQSPFHYCYVNYGMIWKSSKKSLQLSQFLLFLWIFAVFADSLTVASTTFSPNFWTAGMNLFPGFCRNKEEFVDGVNFDNRNQIKIDKMWTALTWKSSLAPSNAVEEGLIRGSKETMQWTIACKATLLPLTGPVFFFLIYIPINVVITANAYNLLLRNGFKTLRWSLRIVL